VNNQYTKPTVLYQDAKLRAVLRPLNQWREGYVDIEQAFTDALGVTAWRHIDGVNLERERRGDITGERQLLVALIEEKRQQLRPKLEVVG
jgi:hypothetical protein